MKYLSLNMDEIMYLKKLKWSKQRTPKKKKKKKKHRRKKRKARKENIDDYKIFTFINHWGQYPQTLGHPW